MRTTRKPRFRTVKPRRWVWSPKTGPERLRADLDRDGIAYFRAPELIKLASAPRELLQHLLGPRESIARLLSTDIRVQAQSRSYSDSNVEALMHTDNAIALPPAIQVMACVRKAELGGASTFVDTWPLLRQIRDEDPKLFRSLYSQVRLHRCVNGFLFRPTVAWRYGNMVITHGSSHFEWDVLGRRFQAWVDRAPRIRFLAEPGDVFVANNLRLFHGRESFKGKRFFKRILAWPSMPLKSPADLTTLAKKEWKRIRVASAAHNAEVREDFVPDEQSTEGLRRFAIVSSYFAGEPLPELVARHGVEEWQIDYWAESALRAFPAILGNLPEKRAHYERLHQAWSALPSRNRPVIGPET